MKFGKKLFALILALTMVVSLIPTAVFAEDQCTTPEVCTEEVHAEGCALWASPAPAACTGDDSCEAAENHGTACPKYAAPPVACTGDDSCEAAENHGTACPKYAASPAACTGDDSCEAAENHGTACPKYAAPPAACTGDDSCEAAENHETTCPKYTAPHTHTYGPWDWSADEATYFRTCECQDVEKQEAPAEIGQLMESVGAQLLEDLSNLRELVETGVPTVLTQDAANYLIMGLTPDKGDADDVAEANGTKYADLQNAIDAANSGDTVTLLADVNVDAQILINKSLTLDLGAYTISGSAATVLRIRAEDGASIAVTINATSGGITATGYAIDAGNADDDNDKTNLTINGGNYVTGGTDCIRQLNGLCTINGGTYKSSFSRTVLNGKRWYGAEFVINGGSFYGFNPACVSVWTGFNGSDYTKFYHQHNIIASGKTAELDNGWYTVVGGTFAPKASTKSLCYPTAGVAMRAVVEMNDMANLGLITLLADDTLTAADAQFAIDHDFPFIFDGHSLTVPDGYEAYETNLDKEQNYQEVMKIRAVPVAVAEVNGTKYTDLQAAIDAANDGDTVTLLRDITGDTQFTIDKNLTLNLGEFTITNEAAGEGALRICAPDAATAINVTINATTGGVKTTSTRIPIYAGHIDRAKTNVTINGGSYESAWNRTVYQNNGVCTINGGSYRANGQSDTANGKPVYNTAVLDNYDGSEGSFVINGGRFYGFNPGCMSINNGDHHDHDSVPAGKIGVLGADGWYSVAAGSYVAKVVCTATAPASAHGHCHSTLQNAINAADVCDHIEMIKDTHITEAEAEAAFDKGVTVTKDAALNVTVPEEYCWENDTTLAKLPAAEVMTTKDITIIWEDNDDRRGIRPNQVTVTVYRNGVQYATAFSVTPVPGNTGNTWHATIRVPKYNTDGASTEHTYSVKMNAVSGYKTSYSADTFTITNKIKPKTAYTYSHDKLLQTGAETLPIGLMTFGGISLLAVSMWLLRKKPYER